MEERGERRERGDRDEGQIEKIKRGDVRDSGHNRDMGGGLGYCGDSLAQKKTELPSQKLRYGRDCIYTYII